MTDLGLPELRDRWENVLFRMRQLSEVSANVGSGMTHAAAGSKLPPGTRLQHRADLRDLSLADYWLAKYKSARGNLRQLQVFLFLAERDLAKAQRRQPLLDIDETRDERERRVISQYAGLSPLEAALAEDCSEGWIRKVRKASGVNAQNGSL